MSWNWLNYISISAISSFIHAFLVFHSSDHQTLAVFYSALPKSRMNFPLLLILGCWWFAIQTEHLVLCLNIHDKLLMYMLRCGLVVVCCCVCFHCLEVRLGVFQCDESVCLWIQCDVQTEDGLQEYSVCREKQKEHLET